MSQDNKIQIDTLSEKIPLLCSEYHVFGRVVERKSADPTAETEYYIIAGMNEVPTADPKFLENRAERCFLLFYPHCFALKIDEDSNPLKLIEQTVEYCKEAEFTKAIFNEFRCQIPEVIRRDELYSLKRYNDQRNNRKLNGEAKQVFHRGLQRFFKKEKSKSKYIQAWKKHYRSERFDSDASLITQYLNFFKRNNPEVSLKTLQRSCENLKLTVMNENEYRYFKKQMKKLYPEVSYAVSDKYVIDHGIIKMPKGVESPFGKTVTYDEFFKALQDKFSDSGYAAVQDLNVSKWEFRNINFRAADESIIASVLNPYRYGFVKDNQLNTILALGDSDVVSIPSGEMMNFYSLAMSYNLPFYIDDHNQFADASLDYVQVVYSQATQPIMNKILNQLVGDKITGSHMITEKQRKKHLLSSQILDAELKENIQTRLNSPQKSLNNISPEK